MEIKNIRIKLRIMRIFFLIFQIKAFTLIIGNSNVQNVRSVYDI